MIGRPPREAAVIDIGSNSVRLVCYQIDGRAMAPFLNEKAIAGLGRELRRTGRLSIEGVAIALAALKRFRALVDGLGVSEVHVVATAAVRDSEDGQAFAAKVHSETGFRLRVLSGEEEARLSALGVLSGEPEARGMIGDLGGASLELVQVTPAGPGRGETFPLGPLSLADGPFDADRVAQIVDQALAHARPPSEEGQDFYAVGGAWRALGRIDIALRDHPLKVLHHHEMNRAETIKVCDFVRKQSKRSLERLEEAAAKRAETLPYAAMVLERVMRWGGFKRVVLSSFGVREGVLFERLPKEALKMHPMIASAEAFGAASPRARSFGAALERWMAPARLLAGEAFAGRDPLLWGAGARMADLGGAYHPDQRAELMFDLVLRAPLAGISHAERAFLAAAIHHRYTKQPPNNAPAYVKLLTDEQKRAAASMGAAMRLGADLTGRAGDLLPSVPLRVEPGLISIAPRREAVHLITDQALRRLDALAQALGLQSGR